MVDVKVTAGESPKVSEYLLAQGTAGVQVGTESFSVAGGREDTYIYLQSDNWGDHNFGTEKKIPGSFNVTLGAKLPFYFVPDEYTDADAALKATNQFQRSHGHGFLLSVGLSLSKTTPYSLYSTAYGNDIEAQDQLSASELEALQLTAQGAYIGPAFGLSYIHNTTADTSAQKKAADEAKAAVGKAEGAVKKAKEAVAQAETALAAAKGDSSKPAAIELAESRLSQAQTALTDAKVKLTEAEAKSKDAAAALEAATKNNDTFTLSRGGIRVAREYGLTSFELASDDGLNVARGEYASEIDDVTSRRTTFDAEAAFNLPTLPVNLLLQVGGAVYDSNSGSDAVHFEGTSTVYGLSTRPLLDENQDPKKDGNGNLQYTNTPTFHIAAGFEF